MSSFADNVDLEAQSAEANLASWDSLSREISDAIFVLNTDLATLTRLLKSYEKSKNVADRALDLMENSMVRIKSLSPRVKSLQNWSKTIATPVPAQTKLTQDKLVKEFGLIVSEYQAAQAKLAEKQKQDLLRAQGQLNSALHADGSSHVNASSPSQVAMEAYHDDEPIDGLVGNQDSTFLSSQHLAPDQSLLNQSEVEYQQNLIAEREGDIQEIESSIQELNDIFTDLGAIVTQQGTIVDNIESNIYNVSTNTRLASSELIKADRYQRRSGARAFCFLMILCILLAVIILATFLS
ncbi:t-SNARE [Nadsonia fulvescens var. elongata DSM 6958]|uniref:t-SNARE n=1 Tax=Nadsonia fulvescens var. elongata DSM 6958 TaxID=857566 RepID=A0A1E3PJU0_9ASCO|nr:t-SNARE [Nadsonia fulvescens var. elongata DSM 6958]